jgi:hypothetical protein
VPSNGEETEIGRHMDCEIVFGCLATRTEGFIYSFIYYLFKDADAVFAGRHIWIQNGGSIQEGEKFT